jgi:branched-chain amino acid aminotransferase
MGVFEGIRSYAVEGQARMFRGDDHYRRLVHSAHAIGLPFYMRTEELSQVTYELLEKNNLVEAYIRPFVFSSPMMSLSYPEKAHIAICAWSWKKLLGDKLINICVSPYCRPHPSSIKIDAKVGGHYVNSILAATDARAKGYDDALQLDVEGNVAECSGANFFLEKDGILYTPSPGHILPGISRDTIFQLCRKLGIMLKQKKLTTDEVLNGDSAFVVGTAAEVTGINSLNDKGFPKEWTHTLGYQLQKEYEKVTREDCAWEKLSLPPV